jgi:hypothetical protein
MFTKPTLLVAAVLAAIAATPAHACLNNCGIKLNGSLLQGIGLNGIRLNGPILQGPEFNGMKINGAVFQGMRINGPALNGPVLQGPNAGGHHGAGLNGQVVAIEF